MKYTHYFDVRVANHFQSDIEDFDAAFNVWAEQFTDSHELRKHLLSSDEDTKSILQGIVYLETTDEEEE